MDDLKRENESLKSRLKKAIALLQEAPSHLDRDFNWVESDKYERKVKDFLNQHQEKGKFSDEWFKKLK